MEKFNHANAVEKLRSTVIKEFENSFPYERGDYRFEVKDITIAEPSVSYEDQQKAFLNDESIEAVVRGTIEVYHKGKLVKSQKSILTRVPYPTDRGSYVSGGNELVVLNRMQRRNGIYVRPVRNVSRTQMLTADVRAGYQRFKIDFDTNRGQMKLSQLSMDYGKTNPGQIDVIPFLKFLGVTDGQIKQAVGDDEMYESIMKNATSYTPRKIYGSFFAKEFPGDQEAKEQILEFMNTRLSFDEDSQKLNKQTIGNPVTSFDPTALLGTISQLVKEYRTPGASPDPDDFRFKEIKSAEDTVGEYVRKGIREWINNRLRRLTYTDMNEQKKQTMNAKPDQYVYKGTKELYNSNLAELVDTSNPLDLHQKLYKVTSLGAGGMSTRAASNSNRNLQDTAFSKIDAVETPQSGRMGLVQHFASGATVKNGRLYSKFYRVRNGKIDTSKVVDDIDPLDEYEEYIAFHNPPALTKDGNKVTGFKNDTVRVRHKGRFENVPKNQVTLIDQSPSAHMSHSTSLIPFGAHNDGARMLMGAGMQKQSLSLEEPEAPLVQSIADPASQKTVEEEMAERASNILRSPVSGTVKKIAEDFIEIDTGNGTEKVKKLNYFTTGKSGGYIHHKPTVKVGDKVKKDDLLADGWQSKNGKLALGRNVRVAYMPFEGYNFEDGVVVSESFAQKMSSEEVKTIEVEIESQEGTVQAGTPDAVSVLKELHVSPGILAKLDKNGIIKKGEEISAGDYLVAAFKKKEKEDLSAGQKDIRRLMRNKIIELPSDIYKDVSRRAVGYQKGKVIAVNATTNADGNLKVMIKLLAFKPMEVGDKLSGRHGNKGTITKIVPDNEMPQQTDGKAVELIFSPLAVPSRKNIGQLLEVNAGLVAEKKGMSSYNVVNFDSGERERLEKELEDIGLPDGKQILINPKTGKPYENPVTVGPMYILKLKHKVESKITARNMRGSISEELQAPRKTSGSIDGDRHNPQGVGGMEFWSLTSAGAVNNIHEMTTLKSDGAGDKQRRSEIFDAIRKGVPIPEPVTPQSLKVLQDKLYAAGVSMTPLRDDKEVTLDEKFTDLMLNPMKRDSLKKLGTTPVTNAKGLLARTRSFAEGGVYDPAIFGEDGDQWGRIDLIEPVPNPLFLENDQGPRPYEAMLFSKGLKQKDIKNIVQGKQFVVLDPKDSGLQPNQLVSMEELDELELAGKSIVSETGGAALTSLIDQVDLKTELKNAEQRLKEARNLAERSNAQKHVMALSRALDQKLEPRDFLMESIPVLPMKYRKPLQMNSGGTFAEDGISKLYQGLLKQNEEYNKKIQDSNPQDWDRAVTSGLKSNYYESVKNIIGVGTPAADDKRGQDIKGIMHGLKSKRGFVRSKMQTKLQDYSGRSVISVDPTLKLDEVALPEDMAAEMFQPLVLGELQKQRYNTKEIKKFITHRTPEYRTALAKVSENRPVILNRQPSLHRHSLQAFYPKISWNEDGVKRRAIGLNPVVTTAFNADFDGDTMAVHLPITTAAVKEAEEKLLPSKNLLNPTNNGLITDLKHEMQLGIYYMTRDRMPEGNPKEYKSLKELEKAYQNGEVKTYDAVRMDVPGVGIITSTAGRHLFNLSLPRGFQDYKGNVDINKKKMEKILMNIINSQTGGGTMKAVQTINKLQNVGFHSATTSGISIGFKDFDTVRNMDRNGLMAEADKALKDKYKNRLASGMIDAQDAFEQEKSEYVQGQMKKLIETSLDPNNPVEIMRSSGARGNAGQINAMAGILGVGKSVTGEKTRPVNKSHLEGLAPDEFWDLSYDSRKGILDKSIESEKPGALTRELWMTNKGTVISEKDCKDTVGVMLDMKLDADKRAIHGRVLLKDVPLDKGGVVKATGRPLTVHEEEIIRTRAKDKVQVRSPLVCKSTSGVCQKCYGIKPGGTTNDFVEIGTPIGSIAAQALGEPSQQAIMKAFHTGAAQSSASGAFDRIQEILRLPQNLTNSEVEAVLVQQGGVITDIKTDPLTGTTVTVDKKKYKLNRKPLADYVKIGVSLKTGDLLTKEFDEKGNPVTIRNPHDVLKYQGPEIAKQYLTHSLEDAYQKGDIHTTDRRHYEVATSNLMSRAVIKDPGTSPFQEGQVVPVKVLNRYNQQAGRVVTVPMDYANRLNVIGAVAAQDYSDPRSPMTVIVKKGETITEAHWEKLKNRSHIKVQKKSLTFDPVLAGVSTVDLASQNWLDTASYRDATRTIGDAAVLGMKEKLDNPLTRQLTGKKGNFGEGFSSFQNDQKDNFLNGFF